MEENNDTLAETISNKTEDFASSITKMYSDEIGYIRLLGIIGSALPIILAMSDGQVGVIILALSFILVLLAMKKVDSLSKNTKSFKYMIMSFITSMISGLTFIFGELSFNNSIDYLLSYHLGAFIVALVMALLSTYFYYKSYLELAKATGLNIFKIAAIMMIVSIFVDFISETLSSILIVGSAIFIIIGWYGIKTINSNKVEESIE